MPGTNKHKWTPALTQERRPPLGAALPGGDPAAAQIKLGVGGYGVQFVRVSKFANARGSLTHVVALLAVRQRLEFWRADQRHPHAPQEEEESKGDPPLPLSMVWAPHSLVWASAAFLRQFLEQLLHPVG